MSQFAHSLLWSLLFKWIIIPNEVSLFAVQWGKDCPSECQCHITLSSQTMLSRWQYQQEKVKSSMCIFQKYRLNGLLQIPHDTESFTFLQGLDETDMTLSGNLMITLRNIISMDVQGSLSNTKLYITEDIFQNMHTLKYLSLQRTELKAARKVFSQLDSLEVLQIIYCNVDYIKWETLEGLASLKELYLIQSGIKELYDFAFYGTPKLQKLFLSHNELFSVDADAFVGLLKLQHLDLSNNKIDHLSELTFPPMPHLQWLDLKHNPIKVIFPHCFQFLNGTQHLTLGHSHQPIHLMKFSFRGLFSLIFLHIPNIDNDALNEHIFYGLQSLLHLNLQGRIKMINYHAFNGAHKTLQKLILHQCKIQIISPNAFYGLENLITLDLSSNNLEYLPANVFEPLKTLKELYLSDNKMMHLFYKILQPLQNLKALRLDANPWNCTCEMLLWKEEIITKTPYFSTNPCNDKLDPLCTKYKTSYSEDISLIPRCEYPSIYKTQSVFDAVKNLHCEKYKKI